MFWNHANNTKVQGRLIITKQTLHMCNKPERVKIKNHFLIFVFAGPHRQQQHLSRGIRAPHHHLFFPAISFVVFVFVVISGTFDATVNVDVVNGGRLAESRFAVAVERARAHAVPDPRGGRAGALVQPDHH